MPVCGATPESHCCWLPSGVCPYFDPALLPGRGCGLRTELGSWAKVYADDRYISNVKAVIPTFNSRRGCGNYPRDTTCGECGVSG